MSEPSQFNRYRNWAAVVALLVAVLLFPFIHIVDRFQHFNQWIESLGPWAPVVFCVAYVVATVMLIPGSALTLGAGLLFGVVRGSIYVSVASTVGACAAFLLARYGFRRSVERSIEVHPRFKAISQAVSAHGWQVVFLTRLSPVLPFTFLNYAYGLTRVSFRDYLSASWLGMIPGTVMYVYIGALAQKASTASQAGYLPVALHVVGLIATILAAAVVARMAKKILNQQMQESGH